MIKKNLIGNTDPLGHKELEFTYAVWTNQLMQKNKCVKFPKLNNFTHFLKCIISLVNPDNSRESLEVKPPNVSCAAGFPYALDAF